MNGKKTCNQCGKVLGSKSFKDQCLRCAKEDLKAEQQSVASRKTITPTGLDGSIYELEPYLPDRQALRILNGLERLGIRTIRGLLRNHRRDLLAVQEIGPTQLDSLLRAVKQHRKAAGW